MEYQEIAREIIKLKDKDLELRNRLILEEQLGDGYNMAMEKLHNKHAEILNKIVNSIGYPTIDKVGEEASKAAWLVIQHAIGKPTFMKKCAKLLEKAVKEQKASPVNLAYLLDRIAVFEGKAQTFGTQFDWDEAGELSPQNFDDLQKVNQRRKSIGLNTLEEQIKIMREQAKIDNETAPIDFRIRKQEIDKWKKRVGWIK